MILLIVDGELCVRCKPHDEYLFHPLQNWVSFQVPTNNQGNKKIIGLPDLENLGLSDPSL